MGQQSSFVRIVTLMHIAAPDWQALRPTGGEAAQINRKEVTVYDG
jgi:hypothetical protein